jgi:hypothetical protein
MACQTFNNVLEDSVLSENMNNHFVNSAPQLLHRMFLMGPGVSLIHRGCFMRHNSEF